MGMNTSMPGQEGIPSVFSPMARTLEDLVYFSRSLIGMKPWLWDHSVHPIEWRTDEEQKVKETKKFKIGVMRTDGKANRRGSVRPKICLLSHAKVSSTHPQPVPALSNELFPLSPPKATRLSTSPHLPLIPPSSSPPSSLTPTAAKCFSPSSAPVNPTILVLANCHHI